jgi:hypothetical protein
VIVAALALGVVLFTPAPGSRSDDPAAHIDRIALMITTESNAVAEEKKSLADAAQSIEELRTQFAVAAEPEGPGPSEYAIKTATAEINARWREFEQRMKIINSIRAGNRKK